jgi:hypothetical protein
MGELFKRYCLERGINPDEASDSTTCVCFEDEIRLLMDPAVKVADVLPPGQSKALRRAGVLTSLIGHTDNRVDQERFIHYLLIGIQLRGPPTLPPTR